MEKTEKFMQFEQKRKFVWVVEVIRCKQPGRWFKKNIPPYAQAICCKTLILNALAIYIRLNSKYKTIPCIHYRTIVYAYIIPHHIHAPK
jgi:hypothetical protein